MNKMLSAFIGLLMLMMPTVAQAQATKYGEVGDWLIMQNETGCYMLGTYDEDMTFSVFLSTADEAEFWIQSTFWKSLKEGEEQRITVQFDNDSPWEIVAKVRVDQDGPGIAWFGNITPDAEGNTFFGEFMAGKFMTVKYREKLIARLELPNTYKASLELAKCASQRQKDPFARGASRDPFGS